MWSGSDYEFSMAVRKAGRERQLGLASAAWLTIVLGVYGVLAVASIWGFAVGAFSGALGTLIALAVITDDPPRRTRRVARIGLGLSGAALVIAAAMLIAIALSEL
jgi:uncharacterized membrane protein